MRSFFAAVARIMQALGSYTTEVVKVGGKWITRLVRVPGSGSAQMPPEAPPIMTADAAETFADVRRVAGLLSVGATPTADELIGVSDKQARWLQVQSKEALNRIARADDDQIKAHVRGRSPITGVVPFDDQAIKDVMEAKTEPAPVRRTRRMELQERGLMP